MRMHARALPGSHACRGPLTVHVTARRASCASPLQFHFSMAACRSRRPQHCPPAGRFPGPQHASCAQRRQPPPPATSVVRHVLARDRRRASWSRHPARCREPHAPNLSRHHPLPRCVNARHLPCPPSSNPPALHALHTPTPNVAAVRAPPACLLTPAPRRRQM